MKLVKKGYYNKGKVKSRNVLDRLFICIPFCLILSIICLKGLKI